jgi:hypothetical protein
MRTQLVSTASRTAIGLLVAAQVLFAAPAQPVDAAGRGFSIDLARSGDFVAQTNFVQCVGASMQMMLNIIRDSDDRRSATQLRLQKLARSLSGPTRSGFQRQGASVRGWMGGLNQLAAGPYKLVGATSLEEAMQAAALAIRVTGKPVGLLVWRGRHAWVMTGFQATADPLKTAAYKVTAAYVLDPLYPYGSQTWGPSPRPRQALSVARVGRQFVPRRQGSWPGGVASGIGAAQMASLSGKYVLVLPYRIDPTPRHAHLAF